MLIREPRTFGSLRNVQLLCSCATALWLYLKLCVAGQEEKLKKHKKRHRSERDAGPAFDAEQLQVTQPEPSPKRERTSRPDNSPKPEPALQRDVVAERLPVPGQRLRSGSPIPRRPERLQAASRLVPAVEKPKPAPKVTGKV